MKKLIILCDADDTIEELSFHWIEELNRKHHKTVKKEDIKTWDMLSAYPDLTEEEVFAPIHRKEFWDQITPIENSGYYLQKLLEDGHDLYIVTATNYKTSDAKVAKLLELFPFLKDKNIIVSHNKQLIQGDVLIDDGVHNLLNGNYAKLLFHQPNNAAFDEKSYDITRVFSWEEIYETICQMAA